jgi:ABC-type phosphate/phosphonate transport system permease subunit
MTPLNYSEKISILGGTVFSLIPNIPTDDLILTIIMAFTGTLVSFIASLLFKYMAKIFKKKNSN